MSINNERRFTVLYNKDDVGRFRMLTRLVQFGSTDQYQEAFDEAVDDGMTPIHLNAHFHNNRRTMTAIFAERPAAAISASHKLSGADYQDAFDAASDDGFLVRTVTAFDGLSGPQSFAVVFER